MPLWKRHFFPWRHIRFDAVHIYRLPLAPFARAFDSRTVKRFLDMDDVESITSDRLAELYSRNDRISSAQSSRRYADVHRLREERCLRSFDGVFVCSTDDAIVLRNLYRCAAFVLPNTVTMPPVVPSRRHETLTILFVGSMDYHPNEDAALQLADFCPASHSPVLPLSGAGIDCWQPSSRQCAGTRKPKMYHRHWCGGQRHPLLPAGRGRCRAATGRRRHPHQDSGSSRASRACGLHTSWSRGPRGSRRA